MKNKTHWGQWIQQRGILLGYRRQADLASAIGCSRVHTAALFKSEEPPRILASTDAALVRVLQTDHLTLFGRYRTVAPEDAPFVEPSGADAREPAGAA